MATSKKELKRDLSAVKTKMAEIDEAINAADADTDTTDLSKEFDKHQKRKTALLAAIARKEALEDDFEDDMEGKESEDDEEEECAPRGRKGKKSVKASNIYAPYINTQKTLAPHRAAGILWYGKAATKLFGQQVAYDTILKTWGREGADEIVAKTAVGAMTTAVPTITQDASNYVVELLNAKSVFRRAGAHIEPMPRGQKTIYRQNAGSSGFWFSEGSSPTVSKVGYDHIDLTWKKMGALVYVTREELMFPSVNTGDFIMNDVGRRLSLLEDITFMTSTGGSNTPVGLIPRIAAGNIISSTLIGDAVTWASVSNDLAALEQVITQNNVEGPFALFCHPNVVTSLKAQVNGFTFPWKEELSKSEPTLNGHRIYTTTQLPVTNSVTQIILAKMEHMIIGDAYNYDLQMSDTGSFIDGGTQVNLFGEQKVAFLGTAAVDFATAHNVSAAVLNATGWTTTANAVAQGFYAGDTSNTVTSASGATSNN